jgi:uncharacterized protein YbjT (DUF2867 family)
MVASWTRRDDVVAVAPLLVQPVAISDVAEALRAVVEGEPQGRARDLAGPERQDLVDMTRRTFAARGEQLKIVPTWDEGPFGIEMAGNVLLPDADAQLGAVTFDDWLATQGR